MCGQARNDDARNIIRLNSRIHIPLSARALLCRWALEVDRKEVSPGDASLPFATYKAISAARVEDSN